MVIVKTYAEPPVCKEEILRYAGCKSVGQRDAKLSMEYALLEESLEECLTEILPKLSYKVCYIELPLKMTEDSCDFGCMQVNSRDLAKNLNGCKQVYLFAATIGVEIDRMIAKYTHTSPSKAVMLQAIGAERIEALCDVFCESMQCEMETYTIMNGNTAQEKNANHMHPRFSPGYGDLPLETQRDIFQVLNCSKNIGLSLNNSLLMSPSKSVTAFVGIGEGEQNQKRNKCAACQKMDCTYRGK